METISVSVDTDDLKKIDKLAYNHRLSRSSMARTLMIEGLKTREEI